MIEPEPKAWLKTRGLSLRKAEAILMQVGRQYPALAKKMGEDLRAKLELIEMIHHVQQGRFPLKKEV